MSERDLKIKCLPCIACQLWSDRHGVSITTGQMTESHHLNLGGLAGQKRRGPEFTIPLCRWHHRSVGPYGLHSDIASMVYGPSLSKQSRKFRETFGSDNDLLEQTNAMLERLI